MAQLWDRGLDFMFGSNTNEHTTVPNLPPARNAELSRPVRTHTKGTNPSSTPSKSNDTNEISTPQNKSHCAAVTPSSDASKPSGKSVNVKLLDRDQLISLAQKLSRSRQSLQTQLNDLSREHKSSHDNFAILAAVLKDVLKLQISPETTKLDGQKIKKQLRSVLHEREADFRSMQTSLQAQISQLSADSERRVQEAENRANELQIELDSATSAYDELQIEAEAAKKNLKRALSVKTAQVGTQTDDVVEPCTQRTDTEPQRQEPDTQLAKECEEMRHQIQNLQQTLLESQQKCKELQQEKQELSTRYDRGTDQQSIQTLKNENQLLKSQLRDSQTKSKNARAIVTKKDEELELLREKVSELQQQVEHGSPAERHILELAQEQARRDRLVGRLQAEKAKLTESLGTLSKQLKTVTQEKDMMSKHLSALDGRHRASMNITYLKNVLVKFMAYADDAPEKNSLKMVLSTLLEFDDEDKALLARAPIPGGVVRHAALPGE